MNHRQRLEACIAGEKVDRPPVSLWRHFPVDDQNPENLADAILNFQKTYDFDFVKVTPASAFCVRDYGVKDEWRGNPEGTREFTYYPVQKPQDWLSLRQLSSSEGALNAQLKCLQRICEHSPKETPIVQTIFNPLAQAKNLVGRDNLLIHMRRNPQELHAGLARLMENTISFIKSLKAFRLDGIFFAVQHAQAGLLTEIELEQFVIPYDNEILNNARDLWLNVIHIHGKNIYFSQVSKFPGAVINWHDQETEPDLGKGKDLFHGAVCGGLRQWETLAYATPDHVMEEARKAIHNTHGTRFILGTGCVLPIIAPHSNISAVRKSVEIEP